MNLSDLKLYELKFTTPLHISNERGDYASGSMSIHSDTFYAAIWFTFSRIGLGELIPKIDDHNSSKFTISSLFPFINSGIDSIRFLPRPLNTFENRYENADDTVMRKKIKKAVWVDAEIFTSMLRDDVPEQYKLSNHFNGQYWSSQILPKESITTSQVIPRAMVPRENDRDTSIFYTERFYFNNKGGLYFLAHFENESVEKAFDMALHFLSDEGLGTDRNIGNGKFNYEKKTCDINFSFSSKRNLSINLGLFCPPSISDVSDKLNSSDSGYELIKRGGWLSEPYNTWRKKSVYMFKEGSVFSTNKIEQNISIEGENKNLKPEILDQHPVWRSGRTLFINF